MEPNAKLSIRNAVFDDLAAITDIYNQAIAAGGCTCDMDLLSVEERIPWFESHDERIPIFVCELAGQIVGYAYISPYRAGRKAVIDVCELSYYVDFGHHRQGIGSALVRQCIDFAKAHDYSHMLAILLSCNTSSIIVLEGIGFKLWGALPDIAKFSDDKRYTHLYYGLPL